MIVVSRLCYRGAACVARQWCPHVLWGRSRVSVTSYWSIVRLLQVPCCMVTASLLCQRILGTAVKVSVMMFSPSVFCVLPCVTSTFTVSKLARIIKQASRVGGGCERVFTPVRWRQVRLSCIKWRSTFFLYFFVRPLFGRQFVIRVDGCCAKCVVGLAFLPRGHTTQKQRHYDVRNDAITMSCARWVGLWGRPVSLV